MKHCVVVVAAAICGLLNAGDDWSRRAVGENAQGDAAKNASIGYAAYVAGYRYAHGKGVERNLEKALEWYLMVDAAEAGHSLAKCIVGCEKWYGRISGSRSEGLELVGEAEKQGSITAYKHLEKLDKTGSL